MSGHLSAAVPAVLHHPTWGVRDGGSGPATWAFNMGLQHGPATWATALPVGTKPDVGTGMEGRRALLVGTNPDTANRVGQLLMPENGAQLVS